MTLAFDYVGVDLNGKPVRGTIGATTVQGAQKALKEGGIRATQINEQTGGFDIRKMFSKPPNARLTIFRSLAALYKAGANATTSFEILIEQAQAAERSAKFPWQRSGAQAFTRSMVSLRRDVVDSGIPLPEAMQRRPNEFTDIESAMVLAGQQSGNLPEVLNLISVFLERERSVRTQIGDALFYPAMVGFAAISLMLYILIKVIPQFADLYSGFDVKIPTIMVYMLILSKLLLNPLFDLSAIAAVVGLGYLFVRWIATEKGALKFDELRMKFPVIGNFIRKIVLVRMCRTMAMLFNAGKTGTDVLTISGPVMGSPAFTRDISRIRNDLYDGRVSNFYEAFERSTRFDPMFLGYMRVAHQTGEYGSLLGKMGDYYEEDVQSLAAQIPNLLQVLITLGLGGVVGLVVSAIYIPLTTLSTSVH